MIEVGHAGGAVFADTQGGFIQVGSARGVQAESMAGTVRVKNDAGPMNLAAMAGNILADLLSGARMQDSSLVAGTGDITVLIPSESRAVGDGEKQHGRDPAHRVRFSGDPGDAR